jgi:hypothetical protein
MPFRQRVGVPDHARSRSNWIRTFRFVSRRPQQTQTLVQVLLSDR